MDTPVRLDLYQLSKEGWIKAKWIVTAISTEEALALWEKATGLDRRAFRDRSGAVHPPAEIVPLPDNASFVVSKLIGTAGPVL